MHLNAVQWAHSDEAFQGGEARLFANWVVAEADCAGKMR